MRIFIPLMIAQFFHQLGGGISQMQGHRQVACLFYLLQSGVDGHVGTVALGGICQVDGTFGKYYSSLRPTYF